MAIVPSFAALLLAAAALAAAENVPCRPNECVLFRARWLFAYNECSSCVPAHSKWRCPSKHNAFADAFNATFSGGFGAWSTAQCQHKSYSPSAFAFSGPSAFRDDFVPACPEARFCACGAVKAKVMRLLSPSGCTDDPRECNPSYWASLAPGFTLVQGFEKVSGGSWEHFDVVYEHPDGRRQFCGGTDQITYHPQYDASFTYEPNAYDTACAFSPRCPHVAYVAVGGSKKAGCNLGRKQACAPSADAARSVPLVEATGATLPTVTMAADTAAAWEDACNSCGTRDCNRGSGEHPSHNATGWPTYRCQGAAAPCPNATVLTPPPAECSGGVSIVAALGGGGGGGRLDTLLLVLGATLLALQYGVV